MSNVHIVLTAYHEAAHAVVALHHGKGVSSVEVSFKCPGNGVAWFLPRSNDSGFTATPGNAQAKWLEVRNEYEAEIRILLAGPLAEAKLLHTPLRSLGARSDLETAKDMFHALEESYAHLSQYAQLEWDRTRRPLDTLRKQTRILVGRPNIWRMIEAIAMELLTFRTMSSEDVAAAIQSTRNVKSQLGLTKLFTL